MPSRHRVWLGGPARSGRHFCGSGTVSSPRARSAPSERCRTEDGLARSALLGLRSSLERSRSPRGYSMDLEVHAAVAFHQDGATEQVGVRLGDELDDLDLRLVDLRRATDVDRLALLVAALPWRGDLLSDAAHHVERLLLVAKQ